MFCVMWHFGDWRSGTAILSATEKGVLFDILVFYYTVERPITSEECNRIARAYSKDEQDAMQYVLKHFFVEENGSYKNSRCEEEIAKARETSEQKRSAANARWAKGAASKGAKSEKAHPECADAMQKECKRNPRALQTNNQEPITNNQEIDIDTRDKPARPSKPKLVKAEGVSDQVFEEWQALKRKLCKTCTQRMVDAIAREAEKAGMTVEQAMTYQLEKGWKGFEADWVRNAQPKKRPTDPQHGIGVCQPLPEEEVHWLTDEERAESLRQMEAEGCAPF